MTSATARERHAYLVTGTTALVVCVGLTLIDIVVGYLEGVLGLTVTPRRAFSSLFWREAPFWLAIAPLVPVVVLVSKRVRLDAADWHWRLLIHLLAAALFSTIILLGRRPFYAAQQGEPFWSRQLLGAAVHYASTLFAVYWLIVAGFYVYRYYHESKTSDLQAALLRESLAKEQLRALRAQLNPHFLFNTLQSVSALAMRRENEAVVETVGRLGQLLRSALDERDQEVALQGEVDFAKDYLELEHLRFSDRLAFAIDISPEALSALVPSMILHPLVDNAVVHGVSASASPVRILVEARREGDELVLKVQDDGPGFSSAYRRHGVGLQNTRSRLEQLYGPNHAFAIEPLLPHGAAVHISLPFRTSASMAGLA